MVSAPRTGGTSVGAGVPAKQVYATAGTFLVIGLAIGYFFLRNLTRLRVHRTLRVHTTAFTLS